MKIKHQPIARFYLLLFFIFIIIQYANCSKSLSEKSISANKSINKTISQNERTSNQTTLTTCQKGLSSLQKAIWGLPYAIAEALLSVISILYFIFSLLLGLLMLILALISFLIFLGSVTYATELFASAITVISQSYDLFNIISSLHLWYAGNC